MKHINILILAFCSLQPSLIAMHFSTTTADKIAIYPKGQKNKHIDPRKNQTTGYPVPSFKRKTNAKNTTQQRNKERFIKYNTRKLEDQ